MIRAKIMGTGSYVPARVLTNDELSSMVETSDEWITTRTGIKERRIADDKEMSSDLGIRAARTAMTKAGIGPEALDLIIVATATPDMLFPSTAAYVQRALGARNVAAFDLTAVCAGFIFGLSVAEQYLKTGRYKTILLIGAETMSRIVDWTDRETCILFGDGAGAVVLQGSEGEGGVLSTRIYTDGSYADLLYAPGLEIGSGKGHASPDGKRNCIRMKGSETFKLAVNFMTGAAKEVLDENKLLPEDLHLLIPHQANERIIKAVAKRLRIPREKVFMNLQKYGNTSAASIPIALDEVARENRLSEGDLVLLVGFGGGLTWGASVIRW